MRGQNQATESKREVEILKPSNPFKGQARIHSKPVGETMTEWHGTVGWVDKPVTPVMSDTAIRCNVLTKEKRLQDITIMVGGGLEFKRYSDD